MNRLRTATWGTQRRAVATTAICVLLLTVGLARVPAIREIGGWTWVLVPIAFLVQYFKDESKQLVGKVLGKMAWLGTSVDREAVRQDLEGTLAAGVGSFAASCPAAASPRLRLDFIKSGEQVQQLPDGTLVVGIARYNERGRNLVAAAWAYAQHGVIPLARPYLDREVSQGVDFIVAKSILAKADRNAVGQFLRDIWAPAVKDQATLKEVSRRLEVLQDDCLLGPVLLTEYADAAVRLGDRFPTDEIAGETAQFVDHLYSLKNGGGEQTGNGHFNGKIIRCAFILVGRNDVYAKKGSSPYADSVEWAIRNAYRSVYLMARGGHADFAQEAASRFASDPRVLRREEREGETSTSNGSVRRLVIRLVVDAREYVDIGYEPRIAVGPSLEEAVRAKHDAQRRRLAPPHR